MENHGSCNIYLDTSDSCRVDDGEFGRGKKKKKKSFFLEGLYELYHLFKYPDIYPVSNISLV